MKSPAAQIKSTGSLRQFLADSIIALKNGHMDPETARNVVKLAGQINESIYSEIKTARVQIELGREAAQFGHLDVGTEKE